MNLTLLNSTQTSYPVMSKDDGGWAGVLEPNMPYLVDKADSDVVVIGNKPDVLEAVKEVAESVWSFVKDKLGGDAKAEVIQQLAVDITNRGTQAVRVIMGDGTTDYNVQPNETYRATARGYIELRELGNVAVDPNQHEAS